MAFEKCLLRSLLGVGVRREKLTWLKCLSAANEPKIEPKIKYLLLDPGAIVRSHEWYLQRITEITKPVPYSHIGISTKLEL